MFTLNMSVKRNLNLKIATDTNLEKIFDLSEYRGELPGDAVCFFAEAYGGGFQEYRFKDFANIINSLRLLYDESIQLPDNFWVDGWFHNTALFPSYSDFSKLKLRQDVCNDVSSKYGHIFNDKSIALHYRGTDFVDWPNGWGDVRLSTQYYIDSLNCTLERAPHITTVNVFTDDTVFFNVVKQLEALFPTLSFNIIQNEYHIDWLCLYFSKNIICSNSTFCVTAAAYNKNLVIQPKKFILREKDTDICFPTNPFFTNAHII